MPGRRSSSSSRIRKNAGKMASTPRESGSIEPVPTNAPSTVPLIQVVYWAALAPNMTWRSNAPSVPRARIHEGSTSG
jgi:hypothetical protein